ncbi:tRNA pseudouridine synthase B [Corynebacterium capitovis DSM 44611]|uniref:tRNA pseudouridine(55) synthase TruB n=1 Tax=Corynebacterium capitovis TaxID=131081 RepID=UPI00036575E4|nr:tRNA pseudouridine(55) synthase TruB [Corynebacterium capitovis]WKD57481.1 tRNA pseudouridine synthase B [Corynebacterium capitovis DSM 44611]
MTALSSDPLATSGLVIVDKPAGMTSHDVVARLRRIYQTRKVGHAGTLDPAATGVLVAGIERGTKLLTHLVGEDKVYAAAIRLGASTTTDDADGDVTARADAQTLAGVTEEAVRAGVNKLTGPILQRPAAVSAIKIGGRRAHELVREGADVDLPVRPVTIHSFDIIDIRRGEFIDVDVRVHCSSGTYIRSLARDLGADPLVGSVGGHLTALRRESVGVFSLDDAQTLPDLELNPRLSLTLDEALTRVWPVLPVSEAEYADLAMGKWLEPRGLSGTHAAIRADGRAVALVRESGSRLASIFVARPSTLDT